MDKALERVRVGEHVRVHLPYGQGLVSRENGLAGISAAADGTIIADWVFPAQTDLVYDIELLSAAHESWPPSPPPVPTQRPSGVDAARECTTNPCQPFLELCLRFHGFVRYGRLWDILLAPAFNMPDPDPSLPPPHAPLALKIRDTVLALAGRLPSRSSSECALELLQDLLDRAWDTGGLRAVLWRLGESVWNFFDWQSASTKPDVSATYTYTYWRTWPYTHAGPIETYLCWACEIFDVYAIRFSESWLGDASCWVLTNSLFVVVFPVGNLFLAWLTTYLKLLGYPDRHKRWSNGYF